ncbi:hypothetical protein ILUMI_05898 [Ignelater luminosus]|uniref:Uncharacterized protein n=1 Tax=Ignelater luminosus TaxID=2038154 RepID=A0A8K0DBR5_IGNLU|nr:hypothetical protein ILUMI_05898 [Ignelater luminosus]
MKISSFCYFLAYIIFTTITSAPAKSLYDNNFHARNSDEFKQYPVKRRALNQEQPYFIAPREDDPYSESTFANADNPPLQRYRRVEDNKPQPSLEKQLDLKRSTLLGGDKRSDRLYKRDLSMRPQRHDDTYGIVYGNGRPIGILEPFPQAYEFAPLFSAREGVEEIEPIPPPPRRSVMDILYPTDSRLGANAFVNDWSENSEVNLQDSAKYNDEKYPAVLNDFKIDSRLSNANAYVRDTKDMERESKAEKNQDKREMKNMIVKEPVKRSPVGITNEKIAELKSALNRIQNPGPSDKVTEIEDNLHDILSDMGLVDDGDDKSMMDSFKNKREVRNSDEPIKRDTDKEDENLEEGLNRIEITKANHDVNKRESKSEKKDNEVDKSKNMNVIDASLSKLKDDDELSENSNLDSNELKGEDSPSSLKSISQNEGLDNEENQNHFEVKRSTSKLTAANYQTEGDAYIRNKRQESKNENNDLMKGLEKSGDLTVSGNKSPLASSGNEAELDKKRNKDQTTFSPGTSEKVKREQNELEYQKQIEQNIQNKIDAIKEQVKREIEALKAKEAAAASNKQETQRKKRETVNTLIEEENSALDPQEHPDEKLIPHIRRRRNLEESFKARKRTKRELPDFSNLNNIDVADYLDLTGQRQGRDDRGPSSDYLLDSQENKFPLNDDLQSLKNAKEKRDTSAQDSNTRVDDLPISGQAEEKKSISSFTVENEQQLRNDPNLASDENHNQVVQKRSAEETDSQKDPDLSEIVNPIQKNETPADREKKEVKEEEIKQKENAQSGDEDSNKKEVRSKSSDSNGLDTNSNLEAKFKSGQNTEESSNIHRRRRQVDEDNAQSHPSIYNRRNKRASAVMPYAKSAFFPYRAEDEEVDDEGDEFDEDNFEDHSALQKRDVYNPRQFRHPPDYQRLQDYDYASSSNNYQPEKRSLANKFVANMNSDVYENPNNYLYNPSTYVRRKRQDNIEQLAALHGGGPMLHHLAAVRERNMQNLNDDSLRSKRNFHRSGQNAGNQNTKEEPENIADLSDTDLFGALPQSYDGNNLLRIKRVKREATLNKTMETSSKEKQGAG